MVGYCMSCRQECGVDLRNNEFGSDCCQSTIYKDEECTQELNYLEYRLSEAEDREDDQPILDEEYRGNDYGDDE